MIYTPVEISVEGREVAMAYDRAGDKEKSMARLSLDLEVIS